jgi:hypothetical protein
LTLSVDVQLPTNRRIIEWCLLKQQKKFRLDKTINVKPLPEAGKPEDFRVGSFDFKVTPSDFKA